MLFVGTESHYPFDAATVVPRSVKEDYLAGSGKVLDERWKFH